MLHISYKSLDWLRNTLGNDLFSILFDPDLSNEIIQINFQCINVGNDDVLNIIQYNLDRSIAYDGKMVRV